MSLRRPGKGSIVDVIAPAGHIDAERFRSGIALLEAQGFRPRFRDDILARDRFLAGSDERRLEELLAAIDAPDSELIWAARGGYGVTRLVEQVSVERIRRGNKALVGFSDLTILHVQWLRAGLPSIHGTMVARLAFEPANVQERVFDLVRSGCAPALNGSRMVPGVAEGVLTGGNLALLAASCGTRFQPDFEGKILFVEEVGERPYRLDRMLVQCRQAGVFDGIAGLALGEFTECEERDGTSSSAQVLQEFAGTLGVPVLAGLPCGHGQINMAMPFGVRARLDASAGTLSFLESLYGEANA